MRSMIRRRRSDEGRRVRKVMMAQGLGDHLPFSFKAYEFDTPPWSSTITTLTTKDNLLIEIWRY